MVANPDTTDRSGKVEHKWYVVRTYSGFEARVEAALRERIKQFNAEASFSEILVPRENVTEVVAGQKRTSARKFYPGYILVKMALDKRTWARRSSSQVIGFCLAQACLLLLQSKST